MSEDQSIKDRRRKQLSRLISGWVKVCKVLSLEEFAEHSKGSRSNLSSQITDPENSRRMSVELLAEAAKIVGVDVSASGTWRLFNRKQQWRWKGIGDKEKASILTMFSVLREECGPANPFVFKPLELLDNPIFNTSRRHAYVEFEDREGARLSVILIADNSKDFEDARAAILGSGLFIEQPAQIISPEAALQFVNGSCDLPEPFHSVDNIDWDDGIRLLSALAMRGISPRKIAELTSVSLPKKRLEPPTKPRFVDDGVAGFTSPPDDKSSSWNW